MEISMNSKMNTNKKSRKNIRIKSRFRFTAFVTIVLILAVVGFNTIFGMNIVSGESKPEYTTIEVLPGETLWDIASEHMPGDMDKREAVYKIQKANGLDDVTITPGQKIKVPVS